MSEQFPRMQPPTLARARVLAADPARRRLFDQMIAASTREEIDSARALQRAWLHANPDDFGVLEAGEALAYAEEALADDAVNVSADS